MFTGRRSIQQLRSLQFRLFGQQQRKLPILPSHLNPHLPSASASSSTTILKRTLAVNALEKALERATTDAGHRSHFFQELLQSKIYVVTAQNPEASKEQQERSSSGKGLYLQPWSIATSDGNLEKVFLPFFSSLENFQEASRIRNDENASHAVMECERFFTLIKDIQTPVVLNPGLSYGKEFLSPEINQLLQDYGVASSSSSEPTATEVEASQLSPETQLYIGQPSEYPTVLIDALKEYLSTDNEIQAAYLAHVYIPDSGEPPHNYIGLQFVASLKAEEKESVVQRVIHTQQQACPDDIVDFIEVPPTGIADGGIEAYMRKAGPFFSRT